MISSARATNEENYLVQKLLRTVIGTDNVDHCSRLCHAPSAAGLTASSGRAGGTDPFDHVETADCRGLAFRRRRAPRGRSVALSMRVIEWVCRGPSGPSWTTDVEITLGGWQRAAPSGRWLEARVEWRSR